MRTDDVISPGRGRGRPPGAKNKNPTVQPARIPVRDPRAAALIAELLGGGSFTGACCAGRDDWDADSRPGETDEQRRARLYGAITECGRCPARERCSDGAQRLGAAACGVWGGVLYESGRPRLP